MIRQNLFDDQVAIAISETIDGDMRFLGVGDERETIANQARLGATLCLANDKIARVKTTYNRTDFTDYQEITTENLYAQSIDNFETQIPLADGLATKNPEIGLLLPLADCLGVVVFDAAQKIVGLLHAGRHNIEQNGPQKFIEYFANHFGSDPKNLQLYYSPYALDYQIFKLDNKGLAEAATEQFVAAGIPPENIIDPRIDTTTSANFPSYSEGDKTKRFAVAVRLVRSERSCGCIVVKDGKVLLTGALTDEGDLYWAFPKGHQEPGETDIETAIRETKEEVGLDVKIIDENPIITGHFTHNKTSYKTIPLFIAEPLSDEIKIEENEIEKVEWVPIAEAGKYFDDYYCDAWAEFIARGF